MTFVIAFFSICGPGHVFPYLDVVKCLIERGHTVDWYSYHDPSRLRLDKEIRASGANYIEISIMYPKDVWTIFKYFWNEFGVIRGYKLLRLLLNHPEQFEEYIKTNKENPDFVYKWLNLAWLLSVTNRAQTMKEIGNELKYDLIMGDMAAVPAVIGHVLDAPVLNCTPLVISMLGTAFYEKFKTLAKNDKYLGKLVQRQMRKCLPSFTFERWYNYFEAGNIYQLVMSTQDLYTPTGPDVRISPEYMLYLGNRKFKYPFDEAVMRAPDAVRRSPKIYISLGAEMCYDKELIESMIKYFGSKNWDTKLGIFPI
jgi:hypothetical protein